MVRRSECRVMVVLWLALLSACTAAGGLLRSVVDPSERLYTNPVYRWSISYPVGWTMDSSDPSYVRIRSVAENALCGIHSRVTDQFKTVDELTDSLHAHNERYFRDRGQVFVILARRRITLPNDIVGNDVLTEIGPGGKSRRIYVLADGRGFTIDCETYAKNWERLEPLYDRIIGSFTLRK